MATENILTSEPVMNGMTATQSYYTWAPDAKPIQIRVDFDVIDRMSAEVMRGFGSVPKRGAEVGGILLGEVEKSGGKLLAHIHDFVIIPCDYRRGPSYQLTDSDTSLFSETVHKVTQKAGSGWGPLGYFRSHTRDGMGLTDDDLQLFSNFFPDPHSVMLLVRPFATKVSQAGFFFEENGQIRSDATYLTFPFRRRELGGGSASNNPASASNGDSRVASAATEVENDQGNSRTPIPIRESAMRDGEMRTIAPPPAAEPLASSTDSRKLFGGRDGLSANPESLAVPQSREPFLWPNFAVSTETSQKVRKSWVWLPLSSIFLLLGVLVGFLIAVTIKRPNSAVPLTAYGLSLAVQQQPDAIHVTWDRAAVPVAIATRGVLHIQDGDFFKDVELKPADLQTGSVIIRKVGSNVTLRLEVFLLDRNSLSETRVVKSVN